MTVQLRPVKYGYWILRWFAYEFLGFANSEEHFPILTAGARFLGCASIACILRVELCNGLTTDLLSTGAYLLVAGLTAVLIGNIVKEMAFCLCAAAVNASGHVFCRRGFTLGGRTFHEAHYPNGTWMRCESQGRRTACEWTDLLGGCHRIEVRPRRAHTGDHVRGSAR